jgi:deoxyribodipyrimidine photo-lyase
MSKVLVWFKRDLRVRDHAALAHAQAAEQAAGLFVIEPEWLASPEFDPCHLDFALQTLHELRERLARRGLPLLVRVGAMPQVLEALRGEWRFDTLLSHEETGPSWSYGRDRQVFRWCAAQGVAWRQWPQSGVQRPHPTRLGWAGRWAERMDAPVLPAPGVFAGAPLALDDLPTLPGLGLHPHGKQLQAAGEAAAWQTLRSFLDGRGRHYRRDLSSPLTAEQGCSRLSPHLAWGSISLRCVHQATEATISATADRHLAYGLRGFAGRLRWHCHFMQKLEDEPEIEQRNFARVFDGLRPGDGRPMGDQDERRLQAWCEGRTGYPMVDACMRSLRATGWLNFRMRAMLVSFAAYHLGLHWRAPGLFLARQFVDFEPGIHWSQMQMQSGTTGINTLRMYSPARQAAEHDPQGEFIRRWLPEFDTPDYPSPIVDEKTALAAARTQLYALRDTPQARAEADAVQQRHGSRKAGLPPTGRAVAAKGAATKAGPETRKRSGGAALSSASPQRELF